MPTVSNVPKTLDLEIYQGATFRMPYSIRLNDADTPLSLVGYTVRAQIRKTRLSAAIAATFTIEALDTTAGTFRLYLSAAQTAAIPCGERPESPRSQYVWDLEIESPSGNVTQIHRGTCKVFAQVTRP